MTEELLRIARQAIVQTLNHKKFVPDTSIDLRRGCFVSLHKDGELRGCIGFLHSDKPLSAAVEQAAVAAACSDHRFPPLQAEELPFVRIEVSVLSEPFLLKHLDEASLLGAIIPGKHGIIVSKGFRSGVLLPQVFNKSVSAADMLAMTSQKAGLPRDAWKDPAVQIHLFTATVYSE